MLILSSFLVLFVREACRLLDVKFFYTTLRGRRVGPRDDDPKPIRTRTLFACRNAIRSGSVLALVHPPGVDHR